MEACVVSAGGEASGGGRGGDKSGALIGRALSYADVSLFILVTEYFDNKLAVSWAMRDCPRLRASAAAVGRHPAIVKYLATRPASRF